jgi:hypothetical protein
LIHSKHVKQTCTICNSCHQVNLLLHVYLEVLICKRINIDPNKQHSLAQHSFHLSKMGEYKFVCDYVIFFNLQIRKVHLGVYETKKKIKIQIYTRFKAEYESFKIQSLLVMILIHCLHQNILILCLNVPFSLAKVRFRLPQVVNTPLPFNLGMYFTALQLIRHSASPRA